MSELAEFVEQPVEEVTEEEATVEETIEAIEPEAEVETEEPEGSPTEPDETESTGQVPLAALLDEREKRQTVAKELEQLRSQQQEPEQKAPDVFEDQDSFVQFFDQKLNDARLNDRITISQEFMRMQHDDYDDVEAKFVELVQVNPGLASEMQASALPAKYVYDTVKKAEKLEKMENVNEWEAKERARIKLEVEAELKTQFESKANADAKLENSLSPSLTNQTAQGAHNPVVNVTDPLDTTFNR